MFKRDIIQSLNDLELSVFNYVIEHADQVLGMRIRDLANNAHVSTTTVLRFCNKFGCEGYNEFKFRLNEFLKKNKRIALGPNDISMIDYFSELNNEKFNATISKMSEIIVQAEHVIFFGIGTSGILGEYGARLFSGFGKYSLFIKDPFFPIPETHLPQTVLIVFSVSGETQEVITQVSAYKQHHCTVISITNTKNSTLERISDLSIINNCIEETKQ